MIRIFRKEFIIGIVGVAVCLCADAFSDVVVLLMEITPTAILWAHQKIIFQALSDDVILFAVPIFATVPFSGAFVEDVKSGYTKQVLPRTTVKDYVIRNEMTDNVQ